MKMYAARCLLRANHLSVSELRLYSRNPPIMISLAKALFICVSLVFITVSAHALTITPASPMQYTGTVNSNLTASQIQAFVGSPVSLTEVYKQDVGGSESGAYASSYTTTFNSNNNPSGALIDYISGPSISGASVYLYVKDGNHSPSYYIFNITGWNGKDDLVLQGFWVGPGAISHVSILSGGVRTTAVPEAGGTLSLSAVSLFVIALARPGSILPLRRRLGR